MHARSSLLAAMMALSLASCGGKSDEAAAPAPAAGGSAARFGPLMMQIGHRLELAGRAARIGRWELATYEVEELTEVYEGPLLEAPAPPEIHARIEPFIDSCLVPLEEAARSHDLSRFEAEFRTTTIACNACHQMAHVPFIEIPGELEVEIPRMTPPTSAAPPPSAAEETTPAAP